MKQADFEENTDFMIQKEITKEEIYELPLKSFGGEIIVIDNPADVIKVLPEIKRHKMLGFDTETKPCFKKGNSNNNKVALLQLSTDEKAWLFRLQKTGLGEGLRDIMSDESITKIGVAIHDDIRTLKSIADFTEGGFLDLQHYVKEFGIISMGLKKLTAIVLNFRISKSQQLSNWENTTLTPGQIRYAATDAWTCLEIYKKLKVMKN